MSVQAPNLLEAMSLLSSAGSVGALLVLLFETGLLTGFLLPGDSAQAGYVIARSTRRPMPEGGAWLLAAPDRTAEFLDRYGVGRALVSLGSAPRCDR